MVLEGTQMDKGNSRRAKPLASYSIRAEERANPGMSTGGTSGAGARKPSANSRTDDLDVGDRQKSQPETKS